MKILEQLAFTFAWMSLIAIGGANAVVPEIHRQIVDQRGWMTDLEFSHLFVLGQLAPGPNVLIVSLIGWRMAGLTGMAVATIAMLLPSSLFAFTTQHLLDRRPANRWVGIIRMGLVPLAMGLLLSSGLVMSRTADHSVPLIGLTVGSAFFAFLTGRNPLWALVACGIVSMVAGYLGYPL